MMNAPVIYQDIKNSMKSVGIGGRVLFDEPMSDYTSMKVGGPAQIMVFPQSLDDLISINEFVCQHEVPLVILGGGTNLLIKDGGVSGVVLCLKEGFNGIARKGNNLLLQAGVKLPMAVNFALEEELSGIECLAGIPGTVGGALYMNAGTKEGSIGQVIEEVKVLTSDYQLKILNKEQLTFGYRKSSLPHGSILLEAKLKLEFKPKQKIQEKIDKILSKRLKTQPIGENSAGCIFKNPGKNHAGKLIESVGLKGYSIGGAQISQKHANFIINNGSACAGDILQLISLIKKRVWEEKGFCLEEEVIIIGEEKLSQKQKNRLQKNKV